MSTEIDSLTQLFVEELDDMLDGVEGYLTAIRRPADAAGALAELRRIAHTVKSSAGMVGFAGVQARAKSLEALIRRAVDEGQPPGGDTVNLLEHGVGALADIARRAHESGDEDPARWVGLTGEIEAFLND